MHIRTYVGTYVDLPQLLLTASFLRRSEGLLFVDSPLFASLSKVLALLLDICILPFTVPPSPSHTHHTSTSCPCSKLLGE